MNNTQQEDSKTAHHEEVDAEQQDSEEAAVSALTALGASKHGDHEEGGDDFEIPEKFTKSGRKRAIPFPLKLMKVLSDKQFSDVITWMPSGKSFSIVKPKLFVATILPDHFKSAKYSSFTRKLHRWGFMRHYRGDEAGAFYHKDFQQGRLDLAEQMTCYKGEPVKPVTTAKKALTQEEPKIVQPAQANAVQQHIIPRPMQQQAPLAQPRDIVAQLQQQQQSLKVVPELSAADQLNAAIEAEVNRRIKERIQAAAISRRALAVMQQINPPRPAPAAQSQWSLAAGSLHAQLLRMQQHKLHQFGLDPSCLAFSGVSALGSPGLEELPKTNIQGAKTA